MTERKKSTKPQLWPGSVALFALTLAVGCSNDGMWDQVAANKSVPQTSTTPAATSNISVLQGPTSLPSGTGSYSFGTIGATGTPSATPVTFTIENLSASTALNVTGAAVGGTHAADFKVITAPAASVAASSTTTFRVVFVPQNQGARTATLTVSSDDAATPSYTITLSGTGTGACAGPFTPGATKRIFATANTYTGNLGGVTGADAVCMGDATAIALGGCWKAMLGDATDRTTSINWVMQADKDYYRNHGTTKILRTNSSGGLTNDTSSPCSGAGGSYNLCNNFSASGNYWTGLNANWSVSGSRTCSSWTSADGTGTTKGRYGMSSQLGNLSVQGTSGTNENCDQAKRLLCVEI